MAKKLRVRIYPDGRIDAVTKGIKGKKCTDYFGLIEKLLNAKTVDYAYTEEYYETEQISVRQTEQVQVKNQR